QVQEAGEFAVDDKCFHRLFCVCLRVATKFWDDAFEDNKYFARIAGMTLVELNILEIQAMNFLRFDLEVNEPLVLDLFYEIWHRATPSQRDITRTTSVSSDDSSISLYSPPNHSIQTALPEPDAEMDSNSGAITSTGAQDDRFLAEDFEHSVALSERC